MYAPKVRSIFSLRALKWLAVWDLVLSALLVWVSIEAAGNLAYYRDHGTLIYDADRRAAERNARSPFLAGRTVIHPYFGYANSYSKEYLNSIGMVSNDRGFLNLRAYVLRNPGCCDYPQARTNPDEVWIGIFGNSVSGGLVVTEQSFSVLATALEHDPKFRGKKVKFLNFSVGGYNVTQTLMVLSYFLAAGQSLDYVVFPFTFAQLLTNFEYHSKIGGADPTFADSYERLADSLDRVNSETPRQIELLYHQDAEQDDIREGALCRSGACYLGAIVSADYHRLRADRLAGPDALDAKKRCVGSEAACGIATHFVRYGPAKMDRGRNQLDVAIDDWRRIMIEMAGLAHTFGAKFLCVVLPSPWMRPHDDFVPHRADEVATTRQAYKDIAARLPELRRDGIDIVDEAHLFDSGGLDLYADTDNHFTPKGYLEILTRLTSKIAEVQ